MKKTIFLLLSFFAGSQTQAQFSATHNHTEHNLSHSFQKAYMNHPSVPKGILEAVAWTSTRMMHLDGAEEESCIGYPRAYSVMGLTLNGQSYFRENLKLVSNLSGVTVRDILGDPEKSILAYAKAYELLMQQYAGDFPSTGNLFNSKLHEAVLFQLSEIPDSGAVNAYARDAQVYQIFRFLNEKSEAKKYGFIPRNIDLQEHYGENFRILSAQKIIFSEEGITNADGAVYRPSGSQLRSPDYGPALWNPAPSCNYSSRNGVAVSAITIHTVQGSYAGAISWAQNCNSNVSYHYVIRSSDGQITQMVLEANKGWHVGSENPYTIGYEHEGYVNNPSWYTTAMYNASAALSRDICNSGYGIPPLRTYYGAASSGTNVLGGCTKIKGHQHYPNQTHTDPGINWNWELYYRLINNNPTTNTLTAGSGTIYDSGGAGGNYANDERYITTIAPAGATSVTITFSSFNTEANWDYLFVYDGNSINAPRIGTYTGTNSPGTITGTTGTLTLEFRSDCSTTASGWVANWTSNSTPPPPGDNTPPSTSVATPSTWVTQNFTATFADADNSGGSGIQKAYYQVIDYDGLDWRANASNGFFSDNFDLPVLHADWYTVSGTWNVVNGELVQSDASLNNTNAYAFIDQSLSNRYLYHWAGKMAGAGTNRRAGLHYFCDDPTLENRGNSYFVWFRLDNDKVQLYEVINDVFVMLDEVDFNFNVSQWYDFKVIYDRITGLHQVYIDNSLVQSFTDNTPIATGDYISFRSGNAEYTVNNLKVYRSRFPNVQVSIGPSGDIRYQNANPTTPSGRVKSIVQDNAGNLSSTAFQDVNVDWTAPDAPSQVNDGPAADISSTTNANELEANWTSAFDQHSGIARYWYSIGTSPGLSDVKPWTDNFWYDTVRVTGLNLNYGTIYYFNVCAENGAGLLSDTISSNGQLVQYPSLPPTANFNIQNTFICAGESISFQNTSQNASTYTWNFTGGNPSNSTNQHPVVTYTTSGTYQVQLTASGPGGTDIITQNISINVSQPNSSSFAVTDTLVYLPNAFVGFTNLSSNANGYVWNFGDGGNSNGVNPWHIYSAAGIYEAVLIAVNDACPADTSTKTIYVQGSNSIESNTAPQMNVHLNSDLLIVRLRNMKSGIYQYAVYDTGGKRIISGNWTIGAVVSQNEIPFSKQAGGLYFIEVKNETEQIRSGFVNPVR